ncbi:hypothetical protein FGO68_gene12744 [Halteria grandinella]|uniref:Uncharacterized protein n=1 Tax=Halteria grandinella TaxID=5974 RepID=A0A8J8T275_HALGN|nr:hypothetical protein FGO68_gene12744 [Halteria grandinella]
MKKIEGSDKSNIQRVGRNLSKSKRISQFRKNMIWRKNLWRNQIGLKSIKIKLMQNMTQNIVSSNISAMRSKDEHLNQRWNR